MTSSEPYLISISPVPFTWRIERPVVMTGYNPNSLANWAKQRLRTVAYDQPVHLDIGPGGPRGPGSTDMTLADLAGGRMSLTEPADKAGQP